MYKFWYSIVQITFLILYDILEQKVARRFLKYQPPPTTMNSAARHFGNKCSCEKKGCDFWPPYCPVVSFYFPNKSFKIVKISFDVEAEDLSLCFIIVL